MTKKSQAAMEFLLTYGWAIVAGTVVISALIYFGVLDFGKFLPNYCHISGGISCIDHTIEEKQCFLNTLPGLGIILRNTIGVTLDTTYFIISDESPYKFPSGKSISYSHTLDNNQEKDTTGTMCRIQHETGEYLKKGDRYSIHFKITAIKAETGFQKTFDGHIRGKVE